MEVIEDKRKMMGVRIGLSIGFECIEVMERGDKGDMMGKVMG